MIVLLLLLAAVGAGAFWAGKNSQFHPPDKKSPVEMASPSADRPPARREVVSRPVPVWPWVVGAAVIGVLLLSMVVGPGLLGGPGSILGLLGP